MKKDWKNGEIFIIKTIRLLILEKKQFTKIKKIDKCLGQ